jgi:hypothetical protein
MLGEGEEEPEILELTFDWGFEGSSRYFYFVIKTCHKMESISISLPQRATAKLPN